MTSNFEAKKKAVFQMIHLRNTELKEGMETTNRLAVDLWNLNMKCYMEDKSDCVQEHDQVIIDYGKVSRLKIKDMTMCMDECSKMNPLSFDDPDKINDEKSLDEYKSFQICAKKCVEIATSYIKKEHEVLNEGLERLKDKYYN